MDGLTVGRIVHFGGVEGDCQAAIISKVWATDGLVNLAVFTPSGDLEPKTSVPLQTEEQSEWHWHWPERTIKVDD